MHLKDQNKRQFLPPKCRKGSTGSSITSSPSPPPISPTLSPWSCSGCRGEMYPGEIAVFAERAAHNACWHSNCFSCTKCGEMLEDLLYFYSNGRLYCGRDFAELMNIPRCSSCDELIFAEEYTKAEGRFWHMSQFCCWICDTALAGKKYVPGTVGQPHCQDCWNKRFGKMCVACGEHIRMGSRGSPWGRTAGMLGRSVTSVMCVRLDSVAGRCPGHSLLWSAALAVAGSCPQEDTATPTPALVM